MRTSIIHFLIFDLGGVVSEEYVFDSLELINLFFDLLF